MEHEAKLKTNKSCTNKASTAPMTSITSTVPAKEQIVRLSKGQLTDLHKSPCGGIAAIMHGNSKLIKGLAERDGVKGKGGSSLVSGTSVPISNNRTNIKSLFNSKDVQKEIEALRRENA